MRPFMRRCLQFNLKTLFLAVLVAAVAAMSFERYWVRRSLVWQPFSVKARGETLASGKIVLIKFTADWDVGSVMLDRVFINSAELRALIRRNRIVTIEVDYTDPHQMKTIAKDADRLYGPEVVPMVAIYKPDKPNVPVFADYVIEEEELLAVLHRALDARQSPAGTKTRVMGN